MAKRTMIDEQRKGQLCRGPERTTRQGFAFRSLSDNSKSFASLGRYQARLERTYHRAVKGRRKLLENRNQKIAKVTDSSFRTIITSETTALN